MIVPELLIPPPNWGIFNVDGNGASGGTNSAVSADLDAARDDAAVNQNPGARPRE